MPSEAKLELFPEQEAKIERVRTLLAKLKHCGSYGLVLFNDIGVQNVKDGLALGAPSEIFFVDARRNVQGEPRKEKKTTSTMLGLLEQYAEHTEKNGLFVMHDFKFSAPLAGTPEIREFFNERTNLANSPMLLVMGSGQKAHLQTIEPAAALAEREFINRLTGRAALIGGEINFELPSTPMNSPLATEPISPQNLDVPQGFRRLG